MDFTVLGLLGPAGSGKDLLADWFCEHGFLKVSFADPIKRFARDVFRLTNEQLWGPSPERNKKFQVDDSWWFWAIGRLGTGSLELMTEVLEYKYKTTGFLALHSWFTTLRRSFPTEISAREILQTLGTEWGREVDPLLWAKYAHHVAGILREDPTRGYTHVEGLSRPSLKGTKRAQGVIIPDHRFANEVATTQEFDGFVIRLRRLALEEKTVGIAGHKSEAEQKTIPDSAFDLVLEIEEFETPSALYLALNTALKDEPWKQGRGTTIRVSRSS